MNEINSHSELTEEMIATCIFFNKEADKLEEILSNEEFRVAQVNCKHGRVPCDLFGRNPQ